MSMAEAILTDDRAFQVYRGLKKRVQERYGFTMLGIAEARRGMFIRHTETGEIGEIISHGEVGNFIVQFDPLGKRRHKKRKSIHQSEVEAINEMEVLAEASR